MQTHKDRKKGNREKLWAKHFNSFDFPKTLKTVKTHCRIPDCTILARCIASQAWPRQVEGLGGGRFVHPPCQFSIVFISLYSFDTFSIVFIVSFLTVSLLLSALSFKKCHLQHPTTTLEKSPALAKERARAKPFRTPLDAH